MTFIKAFISFSLLTFALLSCSTVKDQRIITIEKHLDSLFQDGRLSGNVLIYEEGEILFNKSFGFASYENKEPFNSESIFNIASISKVFTAVAIMQLVESGRIKLEDNITKFFENCPYRDVNIIHLLTHSSGLIRVQSQPFRKHIESQSLSNSEIISRLFEKSKESKFAAGTDYYYSNTNYLILATIVEQVSGLAFADYLETYIFTKSNLNKTFLGPKNIPQHLRHTIVDGHMRKGWLQDSFVNINNNTLFASDSLTFCHTYGASSIYSTTQDLLTFHQSLENGLLLSPESLKMMYHPFQLTDTADYIVDKASNYPSKRGLSWCVAIDSIPIVYHAGGLLGARSFFLRNLDSDRVVILLTNNTELGRYDFTFPMKALNSEVFQLNPKSCAREFCKHLTENGIDSAVEFYEKNRSNPLYTPFGAFDFEEIGEELRQKRDTISMEEVYKLYTRAYPDQYSWQLLAETYSMKNRNDLALDCVKKALSYDPEYQESLELLQKLKVSK